MTENETLELGFLQESESWALTNRYFPSKVGGKPAWLDLENIPSNQEMQCSSCSKTVIFLCQVSNAKRIINFGFIKIIYYRYMHLLRVMKTVFTGLYSCFYVKLQNVMKKILHSNI